LNNFGLQQNITYLTAFTGGLISFLSPCIIPLIPIFFSILITDIKKPRIVIKRSIGFFLGLSLFFSILGVISGSISLLFAKYKWLIDLFGGILIIIFGIIYILKIQIFKNTNINLSKFKNDSFISSFIMGIIISFVWIPCSGPILAAIFTMAATSENIIKSSITLFLYSLGISIPFLFLSGFISKLFSKISFGEPKWQKHLRIIGGSILIIVGILISTGFFNILQGV
jgi:cytochrome c-type biogenesis protein